MKKKKPEVILPSIVLALVLLGILVLASVSTSVPKDKSTPPFYFLKHQILFGLIPGIILMFVFSKIPLSILKKGAVFLLFSNLALCALVFLPKIGMEFSGAYRWIGFGPISFQPSEFLKVTFLIYLAAWLTKKKKDKETLIGFLAILLPITLLLIFQPDISTLGVIVLSAILMYFLSGTPYWHLILVMVIAFSGLVFLTKIAPYRTARLKIFLEPKIEPLGSGYQIGQSLIAIGSGGLFGKGFGLSSQKLGFLPGILSDSIFAIFAEETGFLGSFILTLLFLIFLFRGFKISKMAKDKFSSLLSQGISLWITLQAFVNFGAMSGILPLTGIPLPFISFGGSHLVAELIAVGILLNIAKS